MTSTATFHAIERATERTSFNKKTSVRMIKKALERGIMWDDVSSFEKEYLLNKSKDDKFALYYSGYCFIFSEGNRRCITMFAVPNWFFKKKHYNGKEKIRNTRRYDRNNPQLHYDNTDYRLDSLYFMEEDYDA